MRCFPALPLSILACVAASPVLAQDMCGGMGAGGTWIGGSEATSDITTTEDIQEQMALVLGGNAHVSLFTLSGTTNIRVEAEGRGAADPQLDLFDGTGAIMTSDDDSGGNGAARAELSLDAGSYCLAVRSYDGSPMTSFVRVTRTDQDALTTGLSDSPTTTPDDTDPDVIVDATCAEAQPMTGSLAEGLQGIGSANEGGHWRFSLDVPAAVTITAENSDADPVLTVFDSNDEMIAENDDYDGLNAQVSFESPLDAGEYCVRVTAINDNDLPITTTVSAYDPSAAVEGQINSGDTAPPLDGSFEITDLGTLASRLRQDVDATSEVQWFQIEMPDAGLLLVEAVAVNSSVDPWLVVFDDLGRQIGQNDDYGDGYNSLVAARVPVGIYLVGVKKLSDDGTGPIRVAIERYTAAQ